MYIINEYIIYEHSALDVAIIVFLTAAMVFAIFATIKCFRKGDARTGAFGCASTLGCWIAIIMYVLSPSMPYRYVDALLDQNAPYIAVADKYEIIEHRGLLYTLKEKTPFSQEPQPQGDLPYETTSDIPEVS